MRAKSGSLFLFDLRPQEIFIVASETGTTDPLGCDTKSEACQGNQIFPRTVSPPKPGDSPIYTCINPQGLFPHLVTKLHSQAPTPGKKPTVSSPEALVL